MGSERAGPNRVCKGSILATPWVRESPWKRLRIMQRKYFLHQEDFREKIGQPSSGNPSLEKTVVSSSAWPPREKHPPPQPPRGWHYGREKKISDPAMSWKRRAPYESMAEKKGGGGGGWGGGGGGGVVGGVVFGWCFLVTRGSGAGRGGFGFFFFSSQEGGSRAIRLPFLLLRTVAPRSAIPDAYPLEKKGKKRIRDRPPTS